MRKAFNIRTLSGRLLVLVCVVILPFLRFLLRNEYRIWAPEALAAAAVLLVVCTVLAALVRPKMLFLSLAAACSVLMAVVPTMRLLSPWAELTPNTTALLLGALLGAAVLLLRDNFATILAVFTLSAFGVDVGQSLLQRKPAPAASVHAAKPLSHVLYIVLDEHIGIAGLPAQFAECASARRAVQDTFAANRFRLFTHAYSNYPSTVSSLSSVLNRRVLTRRRMLLDENSSQWRWGTRTFRENRLLEFFAGHGYRIGIIQHRAINHAAPKVHPHSLRDYWDKLGQLDRASGPWHTRFRWLVGNYQQSDLVLSQVKAFFPFRFAPHTTGPLSATDIWPAAPAESLEQATQPTFFFVHVMAPHYPYLFRRDGSVRDLREWSGDRMDQRLSSQQYGERYRRYCEQVESVSHQLQALFDRMRQAGIYDSTNIVIHGDHGSRIRMALEHGTARATQPTGADPEQFDYPAEPPLRDLLDRFSTLFAVKPPHADAAAVDHRKAGLLRLLSETLPLDVTAPRGAEADLVYLFDANNLPKPIPILKYWNSQPGGASGVPKESEE